MKRTVPKQQRDESGRRLCRNCLALVPKRRISYCSKACAIDFEIKYFPSKARRHVFNRDHGICAKCGCDTEKLRRILSYVGNNTRHWIVRREGMAVAREIGFTADGRRGMFWQADHIIECVNGGWGLGLENFQTLCTPCHKSKTAELAAERAAKRRSKSA